MPVWEQVCFRFSQPDVGGIGKHTVAFNVSMYRSPKTSKARIVPVYVFGEAQLPGTQNRSIQCKRENATSAACAKCKVGQVCGNRIWSYLINIIDHRHINIGWLNTSTSFIQCPSRFVRPLVPHFWVAQLVRFKQSKCLFGLRSWIQKKLGRWVINGKAWHWMTRDNMGGSENAPQNRLKWVILNGGTNCLGYSNFEKKTNLNTPYFVDFDIPVWSLCPH